MNFSIPRNKPSELVLYIWKIIDLPEISYNELLYKICFELFILSPRKAAEFIELSIENEFFLKNSKGNLLLSQSLRDALQKWQIKRRNMIKDNLSLNSVEGGSNNNEMREKGSNFNTLIKAFLDKSTINKAAILSESDFNFSKLNVNDGIIKAEVTGAHKKIYNLIIDRTNKQIDHNCDDFKTKKARNKKFCKHLAKLFLIMKEKDEKSTTSLLEEIAQNINNWEFHSN